MEEALHDVPLFCEFAGLGNGQAQLPGERTILGFRHLLERHMLRRADLREVSAWSRTATVNWLHWRRRSLVKTKMC